MINDLNQDELDVLDEFVRDVKRPKGMRNPSDLHYRLLFRKKYGEDEDIELLNDYFYELIENNDLNAEQIKKLAKYISRRERKWIASDDLKSIDEKLIEETGFKYVVLTDGTRIDESSAYPYKRLREEYNDLKKRKLERSKTNGKEFLENNNSL